MRRFKINAEKRFDFIFDTVRYASLVLIVQMKGVIGICPFMFKLYACI